MSDTAKQVDNPIRITLCEEKTIISHFSVSYKDKTIQREIIVPPEPEEQNDDSKTPE
jgi:hypothetical protein